MRATLIVGGGGDFPIRTLRCCCHLASYKLFLFFIASAKDYIFLLFSLCKMISILFRSCDIGSCYGYKRSLMFWAGTTFADVLSSEWCYQGNDLKFLFLIKSRRNSVVFAQFYYLG